MACIKSGPACKGAVTPGGSWGGEDICSHHFGAYRKEFVDYDKAGGGRQIPESFLDDYARIKIILERKTVVRECMRRLANELETVGRMDQGGAERTKEGYVKLSILLGRYEHLCWFPACHHVFLGFVRPDDFLELVRQGILAKDPGAGYKHGDFTHRLQWHAIARVITEDFTVHRRQGWNHTPIELLSSFGSAWAKAANAWAVGLEKGQGFDFPDNLNDELRKGGYGKLSDQISRRYIKRQEQQKLGKQIGALIDGQLQGGHARDVVRNARGRDGFFGHLAPPKTATDKYFHTTALAVAANTDHKLQSGRYVQEQQITKGRAPVALNAASAPPVQDTMPIETRIANSKVGLRKDAGVYCEDLGVLKSREWAHPYDFL
jgi:Family of unknown function (DUF5636)